MWHGHTSVSRGGRSSTSRSRHGMADQRVGRAVLSRHSGNRHRHLSGGRWTRSNAPGDCEVSWLAGLLEGEGTFGSSGDTANSYPIISIQMCDEDVIARVRGLLGSPGTYRRDSAKVNWNPTFTTRLTGHAAASWMRILRPLMGRRRGTAIDRALAAYRPIRLVDPPPRCVVPGCDRPHESRGLCHKHCISWLRDVAKGREPRATPLR